MKNSIRSSIIDWDNRFPLDHWWRKKYNIPYLSAEHRKSTFFGQYFEYHEDQIYEEFYKEQDKNKDKAKVEQTYVPLEGNWWAGKRISKKEKEDWFKLPLL